MSQNRRTRRACALFLVALISAVMLVRPASGSDVTGSAGIDTAIPPTDSAVTVRGRGPYADLEVTVNQTRNLLNQAVSVTWKGGEQTFEANGGLFGAHYLQIMQCWGDDDGTNQSNPGPPPEQCAFGAKNAQYGGISGNGFPAGSFATERIISRRGWEGYEEIAARTQGTLDERNGNLWRDFVAVDGSRIGNHIDSRYNPSVEGGVYWQNSYFNLVTSNEIAGALTLDNGTGAEFFEVVTGIENSGLGCGQRVESVSGGEKRVPKCWIVVVPRSDPVTENVGTPFGETQGVVTSPLAPAQWEHRLSIPIEFNPVDTACQIGEDSTRIVGNELIGSAVSSWQPTLCATPGLRPYSYGIVSDAGARQQLVSNAPGSAGMYFVSAPLGETAEDPLHPTVYAPVTASAIAVGFNIERSPSSESDADAKRLRGVRVATLNLTPRLLAKLVTQSYVRQVNIKRLPSDEWEAANPPYTYDWVDANPDHLGKDEDFLRFNPEFRELEVVWRKEFSGLLAPAGNSDFAKQLWSYILADPEAKAWLDGEPDEWGMRVNPVYATTADRNVLGTAFAEEPPANLPKSDPYCYQAPKTPQGIQPPLLCGTDWNPYTQSLRDGARLARIASDGARLEENGFAVSSDRYYSRTPPQPASRTMLALTDTPSANQFGLQTARLSRAGDGGDDRRFVAADLAGLRAGVAAMRPGADPSVLEVDPEADAAEAYPLTILTYAAIRPLNLDEDARAEYAAFIEYAADAGQVTGPSYGQLPLGYVPLPDELKAQAIAAAGRIKTLEAVAEPEEPEPETSPTTTALTESVPDPGGPDPITSSPQTAPAGGGFTRAPSSAPDGAASEPDPSPTPAAPVPAPADEDDEQRAAARQLVSTPGVPVPPTRFAFAILGTVVVLAGLAALEITKRPRRAIAATSARKTQTEDA